MPSTYAEKISISPNNYNFKLGICELYSRSNWNSSSMNRVNVASLDVVNYPRRATYSADSPLDPSFCSVISFQSSPPRFHAHSRSSLQPLLSPHRRTGERLAFELFWHQTQYLPSAKSQAVPLSLTLCR
ncbi:MAG: hypothetical protein PWQ22_387 [Archaeoglobaceae archaeon]|nr:hypothetical protein [Archaeoglobaceae archaeon]